ncbi:MAG: glucoamylase family protein, partial [Elusimicrobiota bacterium]
MNKYILKLLAPAFIVMISVGDIYGSLSGSQEKFVLCDFNKDTLSNTLTNNLGGESGSWILDKKRGQYCRVDIDEDIKRGPEGYSLRIDYSLKPPNMAQGGFWTKLDKLDCSGYDHIEFYAKGTDKRPFTTELKIQFKKEENSQVLCGSYIVKGIKNTWTHYSIPLKKLIGIQNWNGIDEFLIILEARRVDAEKGSVYFDDIAFTKTGETCPGAWDPVESSVRKTGEDEGGLEYAKILIGNLKGFPEKLAVERAFSEDDTEFLRQIAEDTWKFIDKTIDIRSGLPLDNIALSSYSVMGKHTSVGDYTNITNLGLYFQCLAAAYYMDIISREDAVQRVSETLDTIDGLETYQGFLYNYYDTTLAERSSNFISFVDSAWFVNGLVVIRNAFPEELGQRCSAMIDKRDFSFFYDRVVKQMYHGYFAHLEIYSEYHYGVFNTEARSGSYLAIGKGDAPEEHWFNMVRVFPARYAWQNQKPVDIRNVRVMGHKYELGYYTYGGLKYIPSWGGSLFEVLMPTIIMDEKGLAPKGLGKNDGIHIEGHIKYALEEKQYPCWGMSPCSVPGGTYSEYGVSYLGAKGYKSGVVTPHVTFLSLQFMPEESVSNLRKMLKVYPGIYGEYGFYDSVDAVTGQVSHKYLFLDQGMSFLGLANHLTD